MIKNLEKDIHEIASNLELNTDDNLRAEEAYLEKKLSHLIKVMA